MKRWQRWLSDVQGNALFLYTRMAARTARIRVEGMHHLGAATASGRPLIWAFWHQQTMPFMMYGDRFLDGSTFAMITVGDDRGDILATMARRFRSKPFKVDMQGNPVAAGRAVLAVIKALKQGRQSFLAPDGPDGPAFRPKRGIAVLAAKAQATIVPVGAWTDDAYQLQRWDHYLVPYPFARLQFVFGQPMQVDRRSEENQTLLRITDALNQVRTRAQQLAREATALPAG